MTHEKVLSALLSAILLLSLCSLPALAETWSASAKGFGGDVTVTLTVEDGKVTDVQIAGPGETAELGGAAIPVLAQKILEKGSPNVDAVSGASVTSAAVASAAAAAFEAAGLAVEEAEEEKGEDETASCDVAVIGIEMTNGLGGMGNAAQGMFAIDSVLQHEYYGEDLGSDEQYWFEHIFDRTQYLGNGMLDENGEHTIYHAPISKEDFLSDFEALTLSGDGFVAQTLEEAAAYIGCDPDALKKTVEDYNGYVLAGKDDEFFKSAESLIWTVEKGPFYITKSYNAVLGALGGVNVTEKLEVLSAGDVILPGLYATGNNLSGISVAAYGNVEGVGLSTALTTGRLAGVYAAEYALK